MDLNDYLKFIAALIFVLSLMAALAFVLKRFGLGPAGMIPADKRRMKVLEILPLDSRRRALILRCDEKEHLVILGPSGETVVETLTAKGERPDDHAPQN